MKNNLPVFFNSDVLKVIRSNFLLKLQTNPSKWPNFISDGFKKNSFSKNKCDITLGNRLAFIKYK